MNFILKGNICYSASPDKLKTVENGYIICEGGISRGVFSEVPEKYRTLPITDYGNYLIIPGLCDLHLHAPQYTFRALGMDLELIDWLTTHAFPEEAKYADLEYASARYSAFVADLLHSATTRACIFATINTPATLLLMEKLESSGLATFVGKVNMDMNSPDYLCEKSAASSLEETEKFITGANSKNFKNTYPILTPRFVPTCSSELLSGLGKLSKQHKIPIQSHLSENKSEIEWVKDMYPDSESYGEVYDRFGLFDSAIMAHCVWSEGKEETLIKDRGVYVAHCPQSNTNLASGIAPIRRFLKNSIRVGLGSDVAGGCHISIFRAMSDAVQASKLYWRLINQNDTPLTEKEVFYMGTKGGGSFFSNFGNLGKVGSFDDGYEFDAVIIDDSNISDSLSIEDRLARVIYLSGDHCIYDKYVRGEKLW